MDISPTTIEDVLLIKPGIFEDGRGYFLETYRESMLRERGIDTRFVQDNLSFSQKGVVRGLHYQLPHPQAKLVTVLTGRILDVAVDLREGSPSFGRHTAVVLSQENHHQLFIPEGFAHGFSVLSDTALVAYKCSDYYHADAERGIIWNDAELDIDWQVAEPVISDKDARQPAMKDIPKQELFK